MHVSLSIWDVRVFVKKITEDNVSYVIIIKSERLFIKIIIIG